MNTNSYPAERDRIINAFSNDLNVRGDDDLLARFNMVSAGLYNYLPQIDYSRHSHIFKEILMHQQLSTLEQAHYEALDNVTCENLADGTLMRLREKATIICTYHTGSYRMINLFLTKNRVPYSLVVSKNVIENQGESFNNLYRRSPGSGGQEEFRMIDAESPASGLQMLRELKKGRSLLVYIDGNTGAGERASGNGNCCNVSFLNQHISARKGIGFLAHAADVPVLPVICYRRSIEDIRLAFFELIYPDARQERALFAENITQRIYDVAAPIIEKYPGQWEGWLYLHKVASITNIYDLTNPVKISGPDQPMLFNSNAFGIFRAGENTFLFKKNGYVSYHIDGELYSFLEASLEVPVTASEIGPALFEQLCASGVLLPYEERDNL